MTLAVTTSLVDPVHDLEVNARATLDVPEAVFREAPPPFALFTSTDEVHGALEDAVLPDTGSRYAPVDPGRTRGISEARGLASQLVELLDGCGRGSPSTTGRARPRWRR